MKYIMIIAGNTEHSSDGVAAPDALAFMQREIPKWIEEMDARGVRLFGRELDLPNTAATVRVRDGETLVTDGPFAETKEFMAGFDLLECSGLDEAVEVTAKSPITRFHRMEVRPFMDGLQVGEKAFAFGRGDDGDSKPYLLMMWMGGTPAAPVDDQALMDEGEAWKQDVEARGLQILGNALQGPETARTITRPRRGDADQRRAVHRDQGVHRRHRRRQLRGPPAGDRSRGRASDRPVPRDRGAPVLHPLT